MEESMHVGEQETSLQDQSYHTIRRKIVYLDYKPGEKLGVKQLCDDLDMGRTPVREALVRLAQEGLVRTVPQSGTYVSPINLTFAESACYIREHLEKQVIVECCARATSAGIEQLDQAIALQEKAMAEEDRIGFFLSDNLMHRMIFSIACRSTVWSWLEATNADLERFRWLRAATQRLDNRRSRPHRSELFGQQAPAYVVPQPDRGPGPISQVFRDQQAPLTCQKGTGLFWQVLSGQMQQGPAPLQRSRALVARTAEPTIPRSRSWRGFGAGQRRNRAGWRPRGRAAAAGHSP